MKKRLIFIAISICSVLPAQHLSLSKGGLRLEVLFQELKKEIPDSTKSLVNDSIYDTLKELLKKESSFDYPFPTLPFLGKKTASDKKVSIYTWCYQKTDQKLVFSGIVQRKKGNQITVYPLASTQNAYVPEDNRVVGASDWYGALYLDIFPFRSKNGNVYMLLGWAQNKPFLTMKVIDVLGFEDGQVCFGAPVFEVWKKEYLHRILLEYNSEASITLVYEKDRKRFVFDHLAPINSSFKGDFRYYAPDASYDAYKKKLLRRTWMFQQNVEVENK